MNYKKHCERLLYNLPDLRKLVKNGDIDQAQDWLAEWWYEYEVAKCETVPSGDYSMTRDSFDIFMLGFFDVAQIKTVDDKIIEKRIVDEKKRINNWIDKQAQDIKDGPQGDLF